MITPAVGKRVVDTGGSNAGDNGTIVAIYGDSLSVEVQFDIADTEKRHAGTGRPPGTAWFYFQQRGSGHEDSIAWLEEIS